MKDIKYLIGQRIKELRIEKDLSQEELAKKANINRTYMNGVENGKRNISIINLNKIINALGVSYQAFFDSYIFKKGENLKDD
ncbi:helix-turn-helix domain-containing protein [Tepidimicrobium xylanilyticum]|nr:helix-turn-helix transcriptional regulator [Clostridiaceae bacterium]